VLIGNNVQQTYQSSYNRYGLNISEQSSNKSIAVDSQSINVSDPTATYYTYINANNMQLQGNGQTTNVNSDIVESGNLLRNFPNQAFKLVDAAAGTGIATQLVEVEINGVTYYLLAKT
jgi:hypothetical protein